MKHFQKKLPVFWLLLATDLISYAGSLDTWTSQTSGTTNNLNAITYAAPTFMAVGSVGTILTSTNGINWVSQDSGTTNNLNGIIYANGLFVAVGQGPIRISADGLTWTGHAAPVGTLHGATYGNGLFVVVGASGGIVTSTNGTTWVAQSSGTSTTLFEVTYGNGTFVAVGGAYEVILTSTNGVNWSNRTPAPYNTLRSVTFGNGRFAAVGGDAPGAMGGTIKTSPDGITWSSQNSGNTFANFYSITWGNGSFVTVGGGGIGNHRTILSSTDAISWVSRLEAANSSLNGVVYGNGSFVAVGNGGAILQSGPIFTLTGRNQFANGGYELNLTGEIGRSYRLQASTDLTGTNWIDSVNFTNTDETMQFLDISVANFSQRYYRAVSP